MSHVRFALAPPPMSVFRLSEKDIWPGCREIEVQGEVDFAVSDRLRAVIARAAEQRHHLLVDLSGCDFIDASALGVLVQAHRSLRAHGRQLLICGVRGQVRRLLSITAIAETGLTATSAAPSVPPALWGDRFGAGGPEAASTVPPMQPKMEGGAAPLEGGEPALH